MILKKFLVRSRLTAPGFHKATRHTKNLMKMMLLSAVRLSPPDSSKVKFERVSASVRKMNCGTIKINILLSDDEN